MNQTLQPQPSKKLRLSDILVTIVIAIVFGAVYKLWSPVYYAVKPFGLQLDQLVYGMYFIASTVAYLIVRKPGVALIAEVGAASAEFVTGSEWGLTVLMSGILQGLFAGTRIRRLPLPQVYVGRDLPGSHRRIDRFLHHGPLLQLHR